MGEENSIPTERRRPQVRLLRVLLVLLVGVCFLPLLKPFVRKHMPGVINLLRREETVSGRVREFRAAVEARRIADFQRAGRLPGSGAARRHLAAAMVGGAVRPVAGGRAGTARA